VAFDEIDDDRLDAWVGFLRAHGTLIGVLERELAEKADLPLTWYEVLLRLKAAPEGAMRMQDLARSLLLSKSGATRVVDRMEEAGLVERRHCAADGRGTYASITTAGKRAFRRAVPVHLSGIQEHFGKHLSSEDTTVIRDTFRRIVEAHEPDATPSCDPPPDELPVSAPGRPARQPA
jgi:DNA-binding MarR family transcriptional regulator